MIKPRLFKPLFALLVGACAVASCSVDNARMTPPECSGLNCNNLGSGSPPQGVQVSPTPDASVPMEGLPAKEACGLGSCLPDDPAACSDYSLPETGGGLDAGATADGGRDAGSSGLDGGVDAGAPDVDGNFDQPTPPDRTPSDFACRVSITGRRSVGRRCEAAGSQLAEEACTSSLDCAPGLGCVGTVRQGRCLPFCCAVGPDSCAAGFYCAERPLRSETLGEALGPLVPVCDRADNCSLGEPFDCRGGRCVCGPDTACMLVRTDGATACLPLPERPGRTNEPCPCDRGYHCSQATEPGTCVKTCDLDERDSDTCGQGVCQATPVLPTGWGICVGAAADQMPP